MRKQHSLFSAILFAALLSLSMPANAWWGPGPWGNGWWNDWWNDFFGDAFFDFSLNLRLGGGLWGRYHRWYDYYGPYWGPWGYGYPVYWVPVRPALFLAPARSTEK